MPQYDDNFASDIAVICQHHYNKLCKKGKPQANKEWTLMAAVVQTTQNSCEENSKFSMKVVSMGTGSKCLGHRLIKDAKGRVLHDSHAEVIARRALLRYLYDEVEKLCAGRHSDTLRLLDSGQCDLKPGVHFHLYTSETPCGDASIFPQTDLDLEDIGNESRGFEDTRQNVSKANNTSGKRNNPDALECEPQAKCLKLGSSMEHVPPKNDQHSKTKNISHATADSKEKLKETSEETKNMNTSQVDDKISCENVSLFNTAIEENDKNTDNESVPHCADVSPTRPDIRRTGAKCVSGGAQDPLKAGLDYHTVGVLRTKPGRGDRTLSMSCSDKMARWAVVGLQGALLSHLLAKPVYLTSVVVGSLSYSKAAMERAVIWRVKRVSDLPGEYQLSQPYLLHCGRSQFVHSKSAVEVHKDGALVASPSAHTFLEIIYFCTGIIWWKQEKESKQEVVVNGIIQGVTSKNKSKPQARCCICKYELFKRFLGVVRLDAVPKSVKSLAKSQKSYLEWKQSAVTYQAANTRLFKELDTWVKTPRHYYDFCL